MTHPMTSLRALLTNSRAPVERAPLPRASGNVMMHVTLDEQHATPLRQALIRDCHEQPWTMRIVAVPGTHRVRLSLYLPRTALSGAMRTVESAAGSGALVAAK